MYPAAVSARRSVRTVTLQLTDEQLAFVNAGADGFVVLCGPAGSGKTQALRVRAERINGRLFSAARFPEMSSVETLAQEILEAAGKPLQLIDDIEASIIFERAAEPLLALEWTEVLEAQIDPELAGLRSPERFLENAFRLIQRLREERVEPAKFLDAALTGATKFYAQPPNLAHPDLLYYTKDVHRGSLQVDRAELQRQHRREVDLAKVVHKLYEAYLQLLQTSGALTASDATAAATKCLETAPVGDMPPILIDDAQELRSIDIAFLKALRGEGLGAMTLCGDRDSALGVFSGARPDRIFALPGERYVLTSQLRSTAAVERAARQVSAAADPRPLPVERGSVMLYRGATKAEEAAFIAAHIADLLRSGERPNEIALIFRSVENVFEYEAALLAKGIDVEVAGDLNIFRTADVLDALALLWNVHDPFAHEWLLRTLCAPAINVSDATLVTLCENPESEQTALFAPDEVPPDAERRRDSTRLLRLGWNVTRGDRDDALTPLARERVREFRRLREHWLEDLKTLPLPSLCRKIFVEGLAVRGPRDSARAKSQQRNVQRLLQRIDAYAARYPRNSLAEFVEYAMLRTESTLESCESQRDGSAVKILSVGAAAGQEFDHIVIGNARAGSFPRYYVPDAFLFSPSLGMIAKENAGDARAPRTAKFTYYMFRMKTRDKYNAEERRGFAYALRRARKTALVTAYGRTTRGATAPEFLNELQAVGFPEASFPRESVRSATP